MESPSQILGTDGRTIGLRTGERCRECRGELVKSGGEVACKNCGVVARTEEAAPQESAASQVRRPSYEERLGSFIGTREEEYSYVSFNGSSTVGYIKKVSDHMGEDQAASQCASLIKRVAESLSLPAFVAENAAILSRKILADLRTRQETEGRRRNTVPTISAYCVLSACRSGGVHHVSAKSVIRAHTDLGHRVTKSGIFSLGIESPVPLKSADPAGLIPTVVAGLEANLEVVRRLEKHGVEPRGYFRRLSELSAATLGRIRGMRGASPRTVAAAAVYLAARDLAPKALTQREAAETLDMAEYSVREFCCWARGVLDPATPGPLKAGDR